MPPALVLPWVGVLVGVAAVWLFGNRLPLLPVMIVPWVGVPVGGAPVVSWGGIPLVVVVLAPYLATKSSASVGVRGGSGDGFTTTGGAVGDSTL